MQIVNKSAFEAKPDAVVFDLDNTFYAYDDAHRAAMDATERRAGAALGVAPRQFSEAFGTARKEIKAVLGATASSHSRLLYFQRAIELLGMKTRVSLALDLEQTYWRTFLLAVRLRPGAVDFVMDVRAIGAATAILTDLTAQIQFRKIVFLGLEGLFDFVVTSEEAGADKSGLRPFALMKEKLALPAGATIWMVGDDACDLLAKEALGASTLMLRAGASAQTAGADLVFTDFADVRSLVARWAD
jgi:FMN phosphatase YigB (HAD superfamily)